MPVERYFSDQNIEKGKEILLEGGEFLHMTRVMRTAQGETVELINGKGVLAIARVSEMNKRAAHLSVESVQLEPSSQMSYILIQAIPRMNRLDTIIEKCTELGVTEIYLWPSSLSERKEISKSQEERLRSIAISAIKQCGRLYLPTIEILPNIQKWPDFSSKSCFFGDFSDKAPLFLETMKTEKQIVFVVGPESGLTSQEIKTLKEKGFLGVKLHDNILRTDTAAIVAFALMSHR